MNRKKLLGCQLHKILALFVVLYATSMANVAFANDETQPIQDNKGFKILYHETLDFNFESMSDDEMVSEFGQDGAEDATIMSFDAFDRHFELVLESNAQLIANLPQQQKQDLQKSLQIYRGKLSGSDDSWVRISVSGDQVSGMIRDGDEVYVIDNSSDVANDLATEPQSVGSYSLIYRLSDTDAGEQSCAVEADAQPLNDYQGLIDELTETFVPLAQASMQLDMALVADTQFVNANANPDAAVVARMNVVDGIFAGQVDVHLNITEIRTLQNNGVLTATNPQTLLNQLRTFTTAPGFTNPGLAHLFTGRNLDGSVIGIAYLDVLCNSGFGVGLSQITGGGSNGALIIAHELGHNFASPHDNQGGSACSATPGTFLMNPFINGSDQFSPCSLMQMQPAVQSASCITDTSVPVADVTINFPENPIVREINEIFAYGVEIQNVGGDTADNVTASISVPAELTIQSATATGGTCTPAGNQVNCNLNTISGNSLKTVTITVQANQIGSFVTHVNVAADNDDDPDNNHSDAVIDIQAVSNNDLIDAHFDADSEGFVYSDDIFRNTDERRYAKGRFKSNKGFNGGGLLVIVGGRDAIVINGMSGGWERSFTLASPETVTLALRYRLIQGKNYESDEFSEALVAIDGQLLIRNGNDFLTRFQGNGDGGPNQNSGWQLVTFDLGVLSAGNHVLAIGAYNSKKDAKNEKTKIFIDDVTVSVNNAP